MNDSGRIERIERALEAYIANCSAPEKLKQSMAYSLLAGGKRLRPSLCLQAADMLGGSEADAMPVACALEMIHTYSLIHDDLPCMDNDDMRRGRPSNHMVFGESGAMLAGDGLLSLAFETMLNAGLEIAPHAPRYFEACAEVARGAGVSGMVAGQTLDLDMTGKPGDLAMLEAIQVRKTGALIEAALASGAIIANADATELAAIRRYAQSFGRLFQITDDLLDVTGTDEAMGKTLGKDAKEDKLTAVTLLGIDGAKKYAVDTAEEARLAISMFGERAADFNALIDSTLCRKNRPRHAGVVSCIMLC